MWTVKDNKTKTLIYQRQDQRSAKKNRLNSTEDAHARETHARTPQKRTRANIPGPDGPGKKQKQKRSRPDGLEESRHPGGNRSPPSRRGRQNPRRERARTSASKSIAIDQANRSALVELAQAHTAPASRLQICIAEQNTFRDTRTRTNEKPGSAGPLKFPIGPSS